MLRTEFKNQVDNLMNILFGAGVASHATIIEQINYLVFLRSISKKDDSAMILDSFAEKIFSGELAKYHWDNLLILNAEVLFTTLEEIFRKLPELATDQTIRLLFRDAHVKIFDKPTLRRLVHEIEKMMSELEKEASSGHTDIFGDMYEYLLGKQAQAGTLGQFRTPRHIIKFIVDVIDPNKGETILDPACGTAGFLVSALEHLKEKYTSDELKKEGRLVMDKLSKGERDFVYQHTFTGFDSDFDMFKFGLMNLYLHKLEHPNIKRQNTLVDTAGDRTRWDVILANPPFAGALDQDSVSEDLKMGTRATEVLFLRYIIDHLSKTGRAGVVVPEGIIFQTGSAYEKIRRMMVDKGLWCVVSLPVGVFNPYTKTTKTSILFIDKTIQSETDRILFLKINNDGFDLGAERFPIDKNDLPEAISFLEKYKTDNLISKNNLDARIVDIKDLYKKEKINLMVFNEVEEDNNSKFQNIKIGDILNQKKNKEEVSNQKIYKQITVKMNGKGCVLRKEIKGSDIKTKSQYIASVGDFIMSKIDARNGAFGIVPPELSGAIVTSDFPLFGVDKSVILPEFLNIVIQSPQFIKICQMTSVGTSNRRRVKLSKFLDSRIPLPSIDEQKRMLVKVSDLYAEISDLEQKKKNLNEIINFEIEKMWSPPQTIDETA